MPRSLCTDGHASSSDSENRTCIFTGHMNTAMARSGAAAACALILAACSSTPDSSESQGDPLRLISELAGGGCGGDESGGCASGGSREGATDAGLADGEPPPDYRACQVDSDCVAVWQAGCCRNGWKTAVGCGEQDAYAEAFACHTPHPICPMYIVRDTRVAECNRATHLCEMVSPDQIACGGFILHPHECPDGYECSQTPLADLPGRCDPVDP
jgi:hypothetical protein